MQLVGGKARRGERDNTSVGITGKSKLGSIWVTSGHHYALVDCAAWKPLKSPMIFATRQAVSDLVLIVISIHECHGAVSHNCMSYRPCCYLYMVYMLSDIQMVIDMTSVRRVSIFLIRRLWYKHNDISSNIVVLSAAIYEYQSNMLTRYVPL